MRLSSSSSSPSNTTITGFDPQPEEGEKKCLNSELWHACAGPLVSLPQISSRVVYFPQGHSEQVAASTNKEVDATIPNYPGLSPQLICHLHNVTMHADIETDEVYAQMTLQPLSAEEQKDVYLLPAELGAPSRQPTNYFCKTLTASDTSTHGGFSVPRRAAEKVFPPLDYSLTPPCQELVAKDLHGNEWKFRHVFRGQPKRHLLTTGWSVFVSFKRLVAGDSVIFIWNESNQMLVGIRRSNRPQTVMPSSVLSSNSMHIGLLAAAAHAAATNSRFTIFYNPRASPSEFVTPLAKYAKAAYHTRVSVGMRFRMLFETEESSIRRYMGTITAINDLDPVRWPNSHWRSVKVGWDESTAGERQPRVSLWEIEPLSTFPMYPSPFSLRLKRPWPSYSGSHAGTHLLNFQGFGGSPWLQPRLDPSMLGLQPDIYQVMAAAAFQETGSFDPAKITNIPPMQPSHSQQSFFQNGFISQAQMLQQQQFQQSHSEMGSGPTSLFTPIQNHMGPLNSYSMQNHVPLDSNSSSSKRVALEGSQFVMPRHEELLTPNSKASDLFALLPSFPSREFSDFQGGPDNNGVFGVGMGSSGNMMNGNSNNSGNENEPLDIPFETSSCVDESGNLESLVIVDQTNPTLGAFVKVHKSGSFGRSLDISKFSSYNELRASLGCMFGLEGLLEDPQRSGWQLVFVDRENDILLLGDDPWQEFVNSVWYIKILSPLEVQQMGKNGLSLPNSDQTHNNCDDYNNRRDSSNNLNGIPSVGSLEY